MSDQEDGEVDLEAQRKIRQAQQKATKILIRALEVMKEKNTAITLSYQVIQDKETDLATIIRRGTRANEFILDEELEEELIKKDEQALLAFQEDTATAAKLCQELLVLKTTSCLSDSITEAIQAVDDMMAEEPDKDYCGSLPDINKLLDEMTESLRTSTLAKDHDLRKTAKNHRAKLVKLRAQMVDPPKPLITGRPRGEHQFDFPKVNLPKFKGGLENWHAFWSRYQTAVHLNDKIEESMKMVLLIDLITDPSLSEYIIAANDGKEGRYQEVITYLQERFNRPRELHSLYCKKLTDLQPIKGTTAELSQVADTVFAAVSGLRRSEQDSIEHIATSLVVSILPKHLRLEWENKTEDEEGVPEIDRWIDFVKKKATHATQEQKTSGSPSHPPRSYKRPERTLPRSEGKIHVAGSQPQPLPDPPQPRNKNKSNKTASSSCKNQCSVCSSNHHVGSSWT